MPRVEVGQRQLSQARDGQVTMHNRRNDDDHDRDVVPDSILSSSFSSVDYTSKSNIYTCIQKLCSNILMYSFFLLKY
jgi:hypothetical protein